MTEAAAQGVRVRALDTIDIGAVVRIDEKISGEYRPDVWESRISYYLRSSPEAALVAEVGGEVVGFMLGEIHAGEFGLEDPAGWIEVIGVDPDHRGQAVGRYLAEAMFEHFTSCGVRMARTLVDEKMEGIAAFFSSVGFEPETLRPFVKRL